MITPDPNTPVGGAVVRLRQQLTELEERTGEWPGAEVVEFLGDWLEEFDFTAAAPPAFTSVAPRPPGKAWVLHRWDRHGHGIELFSDEDCALARLARHVRGAWATLQGEGIPGEPPTDDRTAVSLYYGPEVDSRPNEGYALFVTPDHAEGRPRTVPLDFQFPGARACGRANRGARFHAGTDGGLPCQEVDGVLVFAYLDHELGAAHVSIHLDSAPEHLIRPDGTVPLRVTVEDTVVLDDSGNESAPHPPVLDALLRAGDATQKKAILAAALDAALLWRCPACQRHNARSATSCEGAGPCRTPQPALSVAADRGGASRRPEPA